MPRKSFWARLPFGVRMTILGCGVLAVVAGSVGGIVVLTGDEVRVVAAVGAQGGAGITPVPPQSNARIGTEDVIGHAAAEGRAEVERSAPRQADRTVPRLPPRRAATAGELKLKPAPGPGHKPGPEPKPKPDPVRVARVDETEAIRFRTRFVTDRSEPWGSRRVRSEGVPGERTLRYEVTYRGTRETGRRLLDSRITRRPQPRVIAYGTGMAPGGNDNGNQDWDWPDHSAAHG